MENIDKKSLTDVLQDVSQAKKDSVNENYNNIVDFITTYF